MVLPFDDVNDSDWFAGAVGFVYKNGIFKGVSEKEFAPGKNVTRAMLVTVLYRLEGEPETDAEKAGFFEDVEKSSYYENAVIWAFENGIVNGVSETNFAPDRNITREQIAAMLFRFAKFKDKGPVGAWTVRVPYTDLESVSDYAAEAVMFCYMKGLITGYPDESFAPAKEATRAETAAIIERFSKLTA